MIKLYYTKSEDKTPGGLSELAWRLCAHGLSDICRDDPVLSGSELTSLLPNKEARQEIIYYGSQGKPYLKADARKDGALYFNLSHSGEYAVCVIADREVGVDIQAVGPVRERLMRQFFAPEEAAFINGTAVDQAEDAARRQRFARIWTERESYAKLTGEGVGIMRDFYIDHALSEACVMRKQNETFSKAEAAFREAEIDPAYICMICAQNSAVFDPSVPCFNLTGVIE